MNLLYKLYMYAARSDGSSGGTLGPNIIVRCNIVPQTLSPSHKTPPHTIPCHAMAAAQRVASASLATTSRAVLRRQRCRDYITTHTHIMCSTYTYLYIVHRAHTAPLLWLRHIVMSRSSSSSSPIRHCALCGGRIVVSVRRADAQHNTRTTHPAYKPTIHTHYAIHLRSSWLHARQHAHRTGQYI